jgi:hypothetical protein
MESMKMKRIELLLPDDMRDWIESKRRGREEVSVASVVRGIIRDEMEREVDEQISEGGHPK